MSWAWLVGMADTYLKSLEVGGLRVRTPLLPCMNLPLSPPEPGSRKDLQQPRCVSDQSPATPITLL